MGNGLGHAQRIGICGRAADAQLHHMRKALAIGNHLARERGADLGERGRKGWIVRSDPHSTGARSEQQNRVVGGSVAIDGDAIEADLNRGAKIGIQIGGLEVRVGQHINQHRRMRHQLRMDHAGAFAEGGNADFAWRH